MKETFKKYISSFRLGWKILAVIMAGFCVTYVVCIFLETGVKPIGAVLFPGGLLLSLLPAWRTRKLFQELEQSGQLEQVVDDFSGANGFVKDRVRLGRNWIFPKGKCRLIRYQDIRQVYQYVHKTNFAEDERALKYVDNKGKVRVLCKLELGGKSDQELGQIVHTILTKNPNVKVGYR